MSVRSPEGFPSSTQNGQAAQKNSSPTSEPFGRRSSLPQERSSWRREPLPNLPLQDLARQAGPACPSVTVPLPREGSDRAGQETVEDPRAPRRMRLFEGSGLERTSAAREVADGLRCVIGRSKLRPLCTAVRASICEHKAHFRSQPRPASTRSKLLVDLVLGRSLTLEEASSLRGSETRPTPTSTRPAGAGDRTRRRRTSARGAGC